MKTHNIYSVFIKTQDEYYKRHLTHFFTEKKMNVTKDADTANVIIFHADKFSDDAPEIIRRFRQKNNIPIIALAVFSTELSRLALYNAGVDFCGRLPMQDEEIYLRSLVFIRRGPIKRNDATYQAGDEILSGMKLIRSDGIEIIIQARPYQIMCFLFENAGNLVYSKDIIEKFYGKKDRYSADYTFTKEIINVYVNRIRKHLKGTSLELKTVPTRGYILLAKTLEHATPL